MQRCKRLEIKWRAFDVEKLVTLEIEESLV